MTEMEIREAWGIEIEGRPVVVAWWWADKSEWGDGSWQTEPDKVQWTDPVSGLDCLAVRHELWGHWCGYAAVPPGHPLHGVAHDEVDASAHGGVTFSGPCQENPEENIEAMGVCHIPQEGRPDGVFWFGFDAAHAWDHRPGNATLLRKCGVPEQTIEVLERPTPGYRVYRTLAYIMDEAEQLARQLVSGGSQCMARTVKGRRCIRPTAKLPDWVFERYPERVALRYYCGLHGNRLARQLAGSTRRDQVSA